MRQRWLFLGLVVAAFGPVPWTVSAQVELDSVNFQRTELRQALEFLAAKAKERTNQALNVVLIDPNHDLESKPVTLSLSRVPWSEAMRYTCELTGTTWQKEGNVIAVGAPAAVKTLQLQRTKIATGPGSENNQRRLDQMKINHVAFKESSLEEVADYLRLMGRELTSKDPNALPFNVMIKENIAKPVATRKVSVDLAEIPMSELLHYVTGLVNCRYRIDARAVVIGESEDLARPPGGPVNPRGPIFAQLAAKRIQAIDIPAGTTVGEFLEAVRTLGGVNGISLTDDAVASSRLAMQDVTVLELIRYFNEASGTAFRLDRNAFVIADDPAVPKKPRPPESLTTSLPKGGDASGLGFDP